MKIDNPEEKIFISPKGSTRENNNEFNNPEEQKSSFNTNLIKKIFLIIISIIALLISLYFLAEWYVKSNKNPHQEDISIILKNEPICNDITGKAYVKGKENNSLTLYIACTPEDKTQGLGGFLEISQNSGMAFFFEKAKPYKFWMKDTSIYLSAAFLDENKKIIEIYDLEPLSEQRVGPDKNSKYVIETNKGWFQKNDIKVGDTFIFERIPQNEDSVNQLQKKSYNTIDEKNASIPDETIEKENSFLK